MTPEQFSQAYPRLYHMATAAALPSIRRHGLLSTSALLDLYGIKGEERERIESQRRAVAVTIAHPEFGPVVINDQHPMTDETLRPALIDMTPSEWYAHLNNRVFFWVNEARLSRLLNTYTQNERIVLVLDSAAVLARYAAQTMLSPINSGFSLRYAQRRGRDTFQTLADYPFEDWVRKRGKADAVAECTVLGGVTNVEEALLEARDIPAGGKWTPTKPASKPAARRRSPSLPGLG